MKKYFCLLMTLVCMVSCKETYLMPNYFKHHENGKVKQITIESYFVKDGALDSTGNIVVIWGEDSNNTFTYDSNGNILSDKNSKYIYDDSGKLISIDYGLSSVDVIYDDLNEISKIGDLTFRYNNNNQISNVIEDIQANGFFPPSYREYEYNDKGLMTLCKINRGSNIYGSEYNEAGELTRHVYMMSNGRVQEYSVEITERDDKGNWTARRIHGNTGEEYFQKRTIRYY